MKADRTRVLVLLLAATAFAPGCWFYSFSGATIPANLSTIAIPLAQDNSISTVSGLDEQMTQLLVSRFVGQTRLSLVSFEGDADAVLTSVIDRYANQPTSVSGDERATRNRVTITVSVRYVDNTEQKDLLTRSFSAFEEYDPLNPALEEEAAAAALEKVADDIFTAATSNW